MTSQDTSKTRSLGLHQIFNYWATVLLFDYTAKT